jgi:hypothetical protein
MVHFEKYYTFKHGVYCLLFPDRKIYIGSTVDRFSERRKRHFNDMEIGCHSNYEVQVAYYQYGFPEFHIIENAESKSRRFVRERERACIRRFEKDDYTVLNLIRNPA